MTFIYGLFDPRSGECRYIGKTGGTLEARLAGHIGDARRRACEVPRFRWINALAAHGLMPAIRELEVCADWREAEKRWIAKLKQQGVRLLNCTDGGDGIEGFLHSKKTRKLMSESAKKLYTDPQQRKIRGDSIRKALAKPEVKEKLSAALRAAFARPETKENLRRAQRLSCARNEIREKRSAASKGRIVSDETRSKISKSRTGKKLSPESIAAIAKGHRGLKHSEETKTKMRAAITPEIRAASAERRRQANLNITDEQRIAKSLTMKRIWLDRKMGAA